MALTYNNYPPIEQHPNIYPGSLHKATPASKIGTKWKLLFFTNVWHGMYVWNILHPWNRFNKTSSIRHYRDVTLNTWSLISPITRLFLQNLVQSNNKNFQSSTLLTLCERIPSVTSGFSSQRTSNADSVSCQESGKWSYTNHRHIKFCSISLL